MEEERIEGTIESEVPEKETDIRDILRKIYLAVKKHLLLIIAIMIAITACGIVYALKRNTNYIAKESVVYHANLYDKTSSVDSTLTSLYFDTVIDFVNEPIVIDRANFYYDYYLKHTSEYSKISELTSEINSSKEGDPLFYTVDPTRNIKRYITANCIKVVQPSSKETSYQFNIEYTDVSSADARIKVKVLVCAINQEAKRPSESNQPKYFGVNVSVDDLGLISIAEDISKTTIAIVSFVISCIVALGVVYIIEISDRTLKNTEDLESITGTAMLSCIDDQEEG